jgi:hypothetical protein
VITGPDHISKGVAPMRILLFLLVCAAALFLGDMFFYKSRYRNEIWRDMQYEGQKINYEIRRWIKY